MKIAKILILIGIVSLYWSGLNAQSLSYEDRIEVVLDDGTNVNLYKSSTGNKWYYLPPPSILHLAEKADGTPQFLFLKYTQEKRGAAQGALMHFLFDWGFSKEQMANLKQKVLDMKGGRVEGPVDLKSPGKESFKIVSAVLGKDSKLASNFQTSGTAPPLPGSKAAVATLLDATGAQLLDATFQKSRSISDVSIVLNYEYTVLVEAANGTLKYDWDLLQNQSEGLAIDYIKEELDNRPEKWDAAIKWYEKRKNQLNSDCDMTSSLDNILIATQAIDVAIGNTSGAGDTGTPWEYGASESVMRKIYDYLEENKVITLEFETKYNDDRLQTVTDAFFEYFLNGFTDDELPDFIDSERTKVEDPVNPVKDSLVGGYSFKACNEMTSERKSSKEINFKKYILPVTRSYQMVFNLADAYDKVRDNEKCVSEVNLNDPFFQHRDINFILDVEAEEIFQKEINYVTVNVRKKRSSGDDFEDELTISRKNLGDLAQLTYARGQDKSPSVYEYKTQWSLRGGNIFPENPRYVKGDWQGVTLAAPVAPLPIEFEADLEELKAKDIANVTLQLRYQKFGKECEKNVRIRTSSGEGIKPITIFTDKDNQNYAYRLVLTDTKNKKILSPDWNAKFNDGYIRAITPEVTDSKWKKWIEAGESFLSSKADREITNPGEKILDRVLRAARTFFER